ncbi:MAG: helix-turn-helix domain-containing protein, partial [Lactobacillus sp.]|nr:helix-turn-helix domain-containing protein [Lactobacillus sp.]
MPEHAKVLLDRSAQLKYQLYTVLARHSGQNLTITDLAELNHTNYQPTYAVFQEIILDVMAMVNEPRAMVRKALLQATRLPVSLDEYRSYLVQKSLAYRLVNYVVVGNATSLNAFCEQEFVSRSTITRKLRPLNQLMAEFGIKLRLASLKFTGSEANIRYLLYAMYWWAHRGIYWPFTSVDQDNIAAECHAIGIMDERELAQRQQQYFLAICRLRAGKGAVLAPNHVLATLTQKVAASGLRRGQAHPPLTSNDSAYFNFYQISQPRFDSRERTAIAPAQEVHLLTTDETQPVIDALTQRLYRPQLGDLGMDLYLNLLRLVFGYCACDGDFPQAQDIVGRITVAVDQDLVTAVTAVVAQLPVNPLYAGIQRDQDRFVQEVVRLVSPYYYRGEHHLPVRVQLAVPDGSEGYRQLRAFVNAVPWIAKVVTTEPDVVIGSEQSAAPKP